MYCTYCGAQIDDDSLVCCRCGRRLRQPSGEQVGNLQRAPEPRQASRAPEERPREHRPRYLAEKKKSPAKLLVKIVLPVLLLLLALWGAGRAEILFNRPLNYTDMKKAYKASKEVIAQDLMDPESAKFPRFRTEFVTGRYEKLTYEGNEYRVYAVRAYVDAENMFGADLRNYYIAEIGLPADEDDDYIYSVVYADFEVPPELDEYRAVLGLTGADEAPAEPLPTEPLPTEPDPTEPPTEAETQMAAGPLSAELAAVVHGEGMLYLNGAETGLYEIRKVTEYMEDSENLRPDSFSVVDLDQDGEEDLVLTMLDDWDMPWRLLLSVQDGRVYGYGYPFRGLSTVSEDGWLAGSSGASDSTVFRLIFDGPEPIPYFCDESQAQGILERWTAAEQYAFTEENVKTHIG